MYLVSIHLIGERGVVYLVSLCLIGGRRGELGKGGGRALCEPLQGKVLKPKYNPRGVLSGGERGIA